jgi:hypothetical protein
MDEDSDGVIRVEHVNKVTSNFSFRHKFFTYRQFLCSVLIHGLLGDVWIPCTCTDNEMERNKICRCAVGYNDFHNLVGFTSKKNAK